MNDGAEEGESDQLARGAVEVGAAVEDQDGLAAGGEERRDGGALHTVSAGRAARRGGQRRASVAGRDEGIRLPGLLQGEADDDARVGLAADRGEGLLPHPDHVLRAVDLEAAALDARVTRQLRFDRLGPADELDEKVAGQARRAPRPRQRSPLEARYLRPSRLPRRGSRSGVLDLNLLLAPVVTARLADAVRQLRRSAARTRLGARAGRGVMPATQALA